MPNKKNTSKKPDITKMVINTADKKRIAVKREMDKIKKELPIVTTSVNRIKADVGQKVKKEIKKMRKIKELTMKLWDISKSFLVSLFKSLLKIAP